MKNKDEDYTDDVDEKIDLQKKEILVQKNTFETNQNNLNEMYYNPLSRFYTSPDEYSVSFTESMIPLDKE
jgi:hypothetical protein